MLYKIFLVFLACTVIAFEADDSSIPNPKLKESDAITEKDGNECFVLYDVNPGEGFNLRRDVYMRIATLNKQLNCTLVLPPWDHLYHWQTQELGYQGKTPWLAFFNLKQMNYYTKIVELEAFLEGNSDNRMIDLIIQLQHPSDLNGKYTDSANFVNCKTTKKFWKEDNGLYGGPFWSYENIHAKNLKCVEVLGGPSVLSPVVANLVQSKKARKIFLDRAETLLHEHYGQREYWMVRRSMRFSGRLVSLAKNFRAEYLYSTDQNDKTELPVDWRQEKKKLKFVLGGPYIAAHLRRKDFLSARKKQLPSLEKAAKTLTALANRMNLTKIFLATDASDKEVDELKSHLVMELELFTFRPTVVKKKDILDGGVAIVDQMICANARYFIGSHESTFSFRIHEEREIRQFDPDTTFNRFCGDEESACEQPSKWTITY